MKIYITYHIGTGRTYYSRKKPNVEMICNWAMEEGFDDYKEYNKGEISRNQFLERFSITSEFLH